MTKPIHYSEYVGDVCRTACFTGHRPQNMPFNIDDPVCYGYLFDNIYEQVYNAYQMGFRIFMTGMAYGIDLIAGEAVLKLKETYPRASLVCAIPHIPDFKNATYKKLLEGASQIVYFFDKHTQGEYHLRNRFMVDESSLLIAYLKSSTAEGGSYYTYKYAVQKQNDIIRVDLDRMADEIRAIRN